MSSKSKQGGKKAPKFADALDERLRSLPTAEHIQTATPPPSECTQRLVLPLALTLAARPSLSIADAITMLESRRRVSKVLDELGAKPGLDPVLRRVFEPERALVHGLRAHGPRHLATWMERIGQAELERGPVEHFGLLGDRRVLQLPGRLPLGIVVGVEVAGGPLL